MTGVLYGIGVGPGAADLLTVRAVNTLRTCQVVFYPTGAGGESRARAAAAPYLADHAREYPFKLELHDPDAMAATYDQVATDAQAAVQTGARVAILCLGDPLLYGSLAEIIPRLAVPIDLQPGISAYSAAATMIPAALACRDQPLMVVPATRPDLADWLVREGGMVLVKPGKDLARLVRLIQQAGRLEQAVLVGDLSLSPPPIIPLADAAKAKGAYFSMIVIPATRHLGSGASS
ncbi:MAG: precorrin-2 C(20)-methyltransferase [Pseudomonadota bacterium]